MRKYLLALGLVLIAACGDPSVVGGTQPPLTTTTVSPDEPVGGPGPVGSIPMPRPPIDGNIDGEVTITSADLRIMESFPIQVALDVSGEKPTPCHEVFWTVEDTGEIIEIEMISQVASDQACAQVIEPFTIAVPLGSWEGESRDVELNGEAVGSFES